MKISVIADAFTIKLEKDFEVKNIVIDSRKVEKNSVFVAIKGERFDGHDFIEDAIKNGAGAIVSEKEFHSKLPILIVEDSRKALLKIARVYRDFYKAKIIALTGSVGKTSTKELLYSVLSQDGKTLKTEANLNNEIGVALTLVNLNEKHRYAVIEMGMDRLGDIALYSKYVEPDIAIITNIGTSHIGNLGSRENIFKAKTEILPYLREKTIFVCGDDDFLPSIRNNYPKLISYGRGKRNDIILLSSDKRNNFKARSKTERYSGYVSLHGVHNVMNAMAAIAVSEYLGIENDKVIKGLAMAKPSGSRMKEIKTSSIRIIDDSYNASAESIKAALDYLDQIKKDNDRVCAILGDVFEMGTYAEEGHRKIGNYAYNSSADACIFIGKNSKYAYEKARENKDKACFYFPTKDELFKNKNALEGYSVILLKASRGMAFEDILEKIKDVYHIN